MLTNETNSYKSIKSGLFQPDEYSILLIDDDPDQLSVIESVLSKRGYKISCTRSAPEGLLLMKNKSFDLLITDLRMPDYNGFDFILALRDDPLTPRADQLPIIMLSACGASLESVALEIGANMFCEKNRAMKLLPQQVEYLLRC